jgi:hypothetical protein
MFLASVIVAGRSSLYAALLGGQIAVYVLGAAGAVLRNTSLGRVRLLAIPYYFCFVNTAAFFGILRLLRGQGTQSWSTRAAVTGR